MANGEATATVSGGIAPYAYQWSDGQTTATATNLLAGTYSVTVTDANGCFISENNIDILNGDIVTDILENYCSGSNYTLTVGMDIYNETNPSGTTILASANGCDSIVNVSLIFNSVDVDIDVQAASCFGAVSYTHLRAHETS